SLEALGEPLVGASQPLVEGDARLPAELALGERGIDGAPALLTGLCRPVHRLGPLARQRHELRRQGHDVGLAPGTDVHRADERTFETAEVRPHEILYEDVVTGLCAITVDPRRLAA